MTPERLEELLLMTECALDLWQDGLTLGPAIDEAARRYGVTLTDEERARTGLAVFQAGVALHGGSRG